MASLLVSFRISICLVTLAVVSGGCGGPRVPATHPAPARECALFSAPAALADSAVVVLTSPVDLTNAPRATTWGERFVFDLAYDTGRQFDCRGRAVDVAYRARAVGQSTFLLEPIDGGPRLTVYSADESRARDLVDTGIDLLLTDSPALAAYAATQRDVVSVPLGWDRTWVLATGRVSLPGVDTSATFRASLARDVVRADARPAEGPYWWSDTTGCDAPKVLSPLASAGTMRVAYPRDEAIARALAERLVAVLGTRAMATGLAPNAFASALRGGGDLAYIFPVARQSRDRCHDVPELLGSASWLGTPGAITPLIDTRLRAVVRRDRLNVALTWDSALTILPARQ